MLREPEPHTDMECKISGSLHNLSCPGQCFVDLMEARVLGEKEPQVRKCLHQQACGQVLGHLPD